MVYNNIKQSEIIKNLENNEFNDEEKLALKKLADKISENNYVIRDVNEAKLALKINAYLFYPILDQALQNDLKDEAIDRNPNIYTLLPEKDQKDFNLMMKIVMIDPKFISDLNHEHLEKEDKEKLHLEAIKRDETVIPRIKISEEEKNKLISKARAAKEAQNNETTNIEEQKSFTERLTEQKEKQATKDSFITR
jgi:hypothetical protein